MARLIYCMLTSLDGYVADAAGRFDWAAPGEDVHAHVNELERGTGTSLYGRRMWEIMTFWIDPPELEAMSDAEREYAAIWQTGDKVVYSRTLTGVVAPRTRLSTDFDPDEVRAMVAAASADVSISGPELAGQALAAGLVDEVHLYVCPVIVGGGTPWAPVGVQLDLALRDSRVFDDGTVYLRYAVSH
jgi:dihydrofolate reductase